MIMPARRIVTLIPSATEIVDLLGLTDQIVGRSHECDQPPEIENRPVLTRPRLDPQASSAEIHRTVEGLLRDALAVYDLDTDRLAELEPTHIVTQTQCDVCAVGLSDVEAAAAAYLRQPAEIIALAPMKLGDVLEDIRRLARVFGVDSSPADALADRLNDIRAVSSKIPDGEKPRLACVEWCDPLMAAGNWVPEIVELAGGTDLFGTPGAHAPRIDAADLFATDPDIVVFMPCGFGLERTVADAERLLASPGWNETKAVRTGALYATDGDHFFNRPGPRLVESVEILAELLQPDRFHFAHEGIGWCRLDAKSTRTGANPPREPNQGDGVP